jgi:hypothetical protein
VKVQKLLTFTLGEVLIALEEQFEYLPTLTGVDGHPVLAVREVDLINDGDADAAGRVDLSALRLEVLVDLSDENGTGAAAPRRADA